MDAEPAFRLEGVGVRAGASELLRDVDLALPAAEWTAIVGPSGSGKTTLLRLLNRLVDPTAGAIAYRGKPLPEYDVRALRREVGLVVQQPRLSAGTARANLDLPRQLDAIDADSARERLPFACSVAQLDDGLLDREVSLLSGGERQRVALARALMLAPRVLLLDEPTAALDRATAERVIDALETLRREQQVTLITVTHRVEELGERSALRVTLGGGRVTDVATRATSA
jgi:ABC-type methionine transport system ATPase subunit